MQSFLLILPLFLYLTGAISSLWFSIEPSKSTRWAFGCALGASFLSLLTSLSLLISGTSLRVSFPGFLPYTRFEILADGLSNYFVGIISLLACATTLFSFAYVREYFGRKSVGFLGFSYNIFLLSMILVTLANNALMFIIFWELMAVISYFLVTFEDTQEEARRAGFIYLVMTHVGSALILVTFFIFFQFTNSFNFDDFRQTGPTLSVVLRSLLFLLTFIGFGTKAGIIPLHVWLPHAHPSAPSNISALMSGVMIKTAIYAFIRVVYSFLGADQLWWGLVILMIGALSALLGVTYALMEHDLKRLLAYHSVENIGIIFMGIGMALIFLSLKHDPLAALATIAGLYHVMNHAMFKGLLFLCSGSILQATHTRNIEDLGGLIKKMPWTAFYFLIGSVSISALPPFNGFVSEWLTYQSLLSGGMLSSVPIKVIAPLVGAILALTGALAATCFVKAFGITFLALPRSEHARKAQEAPRAMKMGMGLLALMCGVSGVLPTFFISLLDHVTVSLLNTPVSEKMIYPVGLTLIPVESRFSSLSTTTLALLLLAFLPVPWILIRFFRPFRQRIHETWNCGIKLNPRMEYTATAFSNPIQVVFKKLYQPREEVKISYLRKPYFLKSLVYQSHVTSIFEERLYRPIHQAILHLSHRVRTMQTGSIHTYLAYIFMTLILLLIFAR
jgi:hydrogenase-4 component B